MPISYPERKAYFPITVSYSFALLRSSRIIFSVINPPVTNSTLYALTLAQNWLEHKAAFNNVRGYIIYPLLYYFNSFHCICQLNILTCHYLRDKDSTNSPAIFIYSITLTLRNEGVMIA